MSIAADKSSKQYVADVRSQYPTGGVPSTPLEQRVGPHPKKDYLVFKSPPTRQLSREKRQEYQLDVSERFYDDYIGGRTTGHSVGHEIGQGVHKVGFDPNLYRANAYQGLAYDPSRAVPRNLDFDRLARVETAKEKERVKTQMRQRRLSDSMLLQKPRIEYTQYGQPQIGGGYDQLMLPPVVPAPQYYSAYQRPQSVMQKNLEESLRPEVVPEVEKWLTNASIEEQETAKKFLRTISSQGQRPDPASKASKHSSRVRSAVMTPSKQQRQEREASDQYKQLERYSKGLPQPLQIATKRKPQPGGGAGGYRQLRRSNSDVSPVHGSMFTGTRQQKGRFTIHPEWASEGNH